MHIRESYPKKVYLCDTGLVKTFRYFSDKGKLMENAVFLDLIRRKNKNPTLELFYWKDAGHEVDFIAKSGERLIEGIQVTLAGSKDDVRDREKSSLTWAAREMLLDRLTVVTWDYEEEINFENRKIPFIPLWKWLPNV